MLHDKIKHYEESGQMLKNTPAQYKKEHDFLKEVDSLALANAQLNLEKAYKNFFGSKRKEMPIKAFQDTRRNLWTKLYHQQSKRDH